jgi:hypothetical protein
MGNYLINNGPSWVNFCNCEINIKDHNNIWQYINPYQCEIKYWTGTNWCLFELNNIFTYATGQAPTLADFATQIGLTLINGAKFGDTIVFDNVGYSMVDNAFLGVGLTGFLKCSAQTVGNFTFRDNSIKDIYFPLVETTGNRTFFYNEINRIYFPLVQTVGERCFAENAIEYFNAPIIQNIGPTTGLNDVFANNTGNNVTVIVPSIHETSNAGGREGDLQYLDDENTVDFVWDGDEVPDWINTCGTL